MLRYLLFSCFSLAFLTNSFAQFNFKLDDKTYNASYIVKGYDYEFYYRDSFSFKYLDSTITYFTLDSQVVYKVIYGLNLLPISKTLTLRNKKRQVVEVLDFKENTLKSRTDYEYDNSNRILSEKIFNQEDNSITNNTFQYTNDKINGDIIATVTHQRNNALDFYTKEYYDKSSRKYKEVKLASNKKDIIHTENYYYDENGKLTNRSIFFNSFNISKNFPESNIKLLSKCNKNFVLNIIDKVNYSNRLQLIRKSLNQFKNIILDKDCKDFEFKLVANNYNIIVKSINEKINKITLVYLLKNQ